MARGCSTSWWDQQEWNCTSRVAECSKEALALGIYNRVVEDEALTDTVTAMAQHIAEGPPIALGFMKQNINRAIEGSLRENLALEADCLTRCAATDDHKEAVTAFMEKRPPIFQGK